MKTISLLFTALLFSASSLAQQLPMRLHYNRPATYFEESLPIGNGKLGALVYGGTNEDSIYLNDITLWTGKPVDHNEGNGLSSWIPKIREALFNEDYRKADSLQHYVQGHGSEFYQPLATLKIKSLNAQPVSNYYRELDLDSAIAKDSYTIDGVRYEREYFASNPDKMIAIHIKANRKNALNLQLSLTSQVPHSCKASHGNTLTLLGHALGDEQESIHFCTILRVITDNKSWGTDSTLTIQDATEATIYIVNETTFNGADKHPVKEGAPYLENVANDLWHLVNYTYQQLRHRHIEDYKKYFDRVKLFIAGSEENKQQTTEQQLINYTDLKSNNPYLETLYFQYGRYLLISSSRTNGVPANLQGLWTPHLYSPWRGNYTMNINIEENYWPAFTTNLAEMAAPLDGFIEALCKNGQYTAKNFYGVSSGWCASHNSDIWAMTNPVGEQKENPKWANWNMGGAWIVNTLWEKYLFTQDKNYLKGIAYPLLKGASEFCEQWLTDNPKVPGELITAPSTSPENNYITDKGYHGATCYGGTADLAIMRELFSNTFEAQQLLNINPSDTTLMAVYHRLHPYTIGHMGDLNEWYYDWDDSDFLHRHQSHLIGLYPGHHLSVAQTPALAKAATRSLEIKGDKTTGWSTGWRINLWARLHRADKAYDLLRCLLTFVRPEGYDGPDQRHGGGTYANLFDAHPPFQIDGNFGGTAGIAEMLLQSESHPNKAEDIIELLPALPKSWPSGEVNGLCARGGYVVDFSWKNAKIKKLSIYSKAGGTVLLKYNDTEKRISLKKGQRKKVK